MTRNGSFTLRQTCGLVFLMEEQTDGLLQPSKGATSTEEGHSPLDGSQLAACRLLHCEVHLVLLRAIIALVDWRERERNRKTWRRLSGNVLIRQRSSGSERKVRWVCFCHGRLTLRHNNCLFLSNVLHKRLSAVPCKHNMLFVYFHVMCGREVWL